MTDIAFCISKNKIEHDGVKFSQCLVEFEHVFGKHHIDNADPATIAFIEGPSQTDDFTG